MKLKLCKDKEREESNRLFNRKSEKRTRKISFNVSFIHFPIKQFAELTLKIPPRDWKSYFNRKKEEFRALFAQKHSHK